MRLFSPTNPGPLGTSWQSNGRFTPAGIMAWIEQLNEVDIDGVEPMTSAVEGLSLPMREDVVTDGDNPDRVLKNAPKSEDGFFVVPKVVE